MNTVIRTPVLSRRRIWTALGIAVVADGLQVVLELAGGPLGYAIADVIDVVTMVTMTVLLGFHPLFLPAFVAEFMPVIDMLPTWTACVGVVIALRRKQQQPVEPPPPPPGDVIDV